MFTITTLPEDLRDSMCHHGVWKKECPVTLERLQLVTISYWDFMGQEQHHGRIVVLDVVASRVLKIFQALHAHHFPIAKIEPIDHYGGSDDQSMAANNTSGFNYRRITGSSRLSLHAYGLAIDVNPVQNPYLTWTKNIPSGYIQVAPIAGNHFLNRRHIRPGMVEPILHIFKENGFKEWGGEWNTTLDWHHFQCSETLAKQLMNHNFQEGKELFKKYIAG